MVKDHSDNIRYTMKREATTYEQKLCKGIALTVARIKTWQELALQLLQHEVGN
jgi:hypothetical protein